MSAIPFDTPTAEVAAPRWRWLPAPNTWQYHALLLTLGILVLGPLGGLTASYMNFSIGFFVGGQVLAGLLGSTVTFGYGVEGKHGANYIQTAAASVAGMSAMGVLIQAMVWLGLPQPPMWQLVLYMLTIGMFGAGIGMLYTPILVDRMKLVFPSGLAVANILRALTDPVLLRRSVALLGGGVAGGLAGGIAAAKVAILGTIELSTSTFGAGMVVGARIGLAAVTGGVIGIALKPYFVSIGWLEAGDPPRKIMFLIALGWIMGAAIVDMALILARAVKRWRETAVVPGARAEASPCMAGAASTRSGSSSGRSPGARRSSPSAISSCTSRCSTSSSRSCSSACSRSSTASRSASATRTPSRRRSSSPSSSSPRSVSRTPPSA